MRKWTVTIIIGILILIISMGIYLCFYYNIFEGKYYKDEDFGITKVLSDSDYDNDGIDDYLDMLLGARSYVETKPKYKSEYYSTGYPPEGVGVCTDVVGAAFKSAGYDIQELVNQDILNNRDRYPLITTVDKNIDFRRVRNLKIFLDNNATILTNDLNDYKEWQGGDIVVFDKHIAIVSDKRNKNGIPYIIHHGGQIRYEEDGIKRFSVVGHYRYPRREEAHA